MKYLFLIFFIVLAGCQQNGSSLINATSTSEQCDNQQKYCIDFATSMFGRKWTDQWTGLSGEVTDHTISNGLTPESSTYTRADFYPTPSCAPEAIGIGSPEDIQVPGADNTIFGRMDYREIYWTMDFPIAFTDICGIQTGEAIYAFCSEKVGDPAKAVDDKRVVICISQQTDDLEQAEEIFKSFRWTE